MVSFEQLREVDLVGLRATAQRWTGLAHRLRGLEDEHTLGCVRPLGDSGWTGPAATAAARGLDSNAQRLAAASIETHAVATALGDAATDLTGLQRQLRKLVEEAAAERLRVTAAGRVTVPDGLVEPDPARQTEQDKEFLAGLRRTATRLQTQLDHTVRLAGEVDERSAWALRMDTGQNTQAFNAAAIAGGDAGDAQRAAELMARKPPTAAELEALRHLLAANVHDAAFATDLLTRLGPRDLLAFSAALLPRTAGPLTLPSPPHSDAIHAALGNLLALATDQTRAVHLPADWAGQLTAHAKDRLILPDLTSVIGYEALAPLLRHGQYSPETISAIGDDLIAYERAHPGFAGLASSVSNPRLSDAPMTALLDGLAHNPVAAEEFFGGSRDPENASGLNGEQRLAYLLRERHWETTPGVPIAGLDSAGHALEAATASQSPASTAITAKAVWLFTHGADGVALPLSAVDVPIELRDSVGRMLGSHIHEVNQALGHQEGEKQSGPLDAKSLVPLLNSVARDPEGFGAIAAANNVYLEHEGQRIATDPRLSAADRTMMLDQLNRHAGTTRAVLDEIVTDEIYAKHLASDKAYNDSLATATAAIAGIATLGTERIPLGGGLVDAGIEALSEKILEEYRQNTVSEAEQQTRDAYEKGRSDVNGSAKKAIIQAAIINGDIPIPLPGESHQDWYRKNGARIDLIVKNGLSETVTGYDHGKIEYLEKMGIKNVKRGYDGD